MKTVKVVRLGEVQPTIIPGEVIQRLITKKREGSERMSLSVSRIQKGFDLPIDSGETDWIMYLLEGTAKISWEGGKAEVKPGMAAYIPAGTKWRYQTDVENVGIFLLSPPVE